MTVSHGTYSRVKMKIWIITEATGKVYEEPDWFHLNECACANCRSAVNNTDSDGFGQDCLETERLPGLLNSV